MMSWTVVGWSLVVLVGLTALHGMHRPGLWLEERGDIDYLHKKPSGSSMGGFDEASGDAEPDPPTFLHP